MFFYMLFVTFMTVYVVQASLDLRTELPPTDDPSIANPTSFYTLDRTYYLVVRDVQSLPRILAGALRQWFERVTTMQQD